MAENKNAQQVREITDKLEQGIKELFESERFKEYLLSLIHIYVYKRQGLLSPKLTTGTRQAWQRRQGFYRYLNVAALPCSLIPTPPDDEPSPDIFHLQEDFE